MPPTGNHRNVTEVRVMAPTGGKKGNKRCPRCARDFYAFPHTTNTDKYRTWREATAWEIKANFKGAGPLVKVYVRIFGGRGFAESRDLDNLLKCLGDAIADSGVIPSDKAKDLKAWDIAYLDREEHMAALGSAAPSKPDMLNARCLVRIETIQLGDLLDDDARKRLQTTLARRLTPSEVE